MTGQSFVPLPGSERGSLPESQQLGAVDEAQQIEVTLVTRRRAALPRDLVEGPATLTREQFAEQHGTDPADLDLISTVLAGHGLRVTSADAGARRVTVDGHDRGPVRDLRGHAAPGPHAGPGHGQDTVEHRYREGGLQIPAELNGIVLAVLGLDDRPQARAQFRRAPPRGPGPRHRVSDRHRTGPGRARRRPPPRPRRPRPTPRRRSPSCTSSRRAPTGPGRPSRSSSWAAGSAAATSIPTSPGWASRSPRSPRPAWTARSTSPARTRTAPTARSCWTSRWPAAVAPGAAQVVYFAPNTDQGFVDAVTTAVHATPTPAVVSISWGQSEDSWTAQARTSPGPGDGGRGRARRHGHRRSRGQRQQRRPERRRRPRRLPRVQPARAGLRRDEPARQRRDRRDQLRDGLERRGLGRRHRRRRERHLRPPVLAGHRRASRPRPGRGGPGGGPGRARRGRLRRPGHRLSGPGGRAVHGDRRDECRGPAVGRR